MTKKAENAINPSSTKNTMKSYLSNLHKRFIKFCCGISMKISKWLKTNLKHNTVQTEFHSNPNKNKKMLLIFLSIKIILLCMIISLFSVHNTKTFSCNETISLEKNGKILKNWKLRCRI